MNIDAPHMTPVTINSGSDHYMTRIIAQERNGRTLLVMPEWAIVAAYLPHDFAIEALTAELEAVHALEERTGRRLAPLRAGVPAQQHYRPQVYTTRTATSPGWGAANYGTLTIGVAVNQLVGRPDGHVLKGSGRGQACTSACLPRLTGRPSLWAPLALAYVVASEMAPHRQRPQPVQQPQPQPGAACFQQRATFYDQAAPVRGERYDHAVMRLRAQH